MEHTEDNKKVFAQIPASKKWVVVLSPRGAEIHQGLSGRTLTVLPFDDRNLADLICRCFNAHDPLRKQRDNLLAACEGLLRLIQGPYDVDNLTTQVRTTTEQAEAAIKKAER